MQLTTYYQTISSYITTIHPYIYNSIGIYGLWILIHYGASNLYANTCNNWSIYGFISSPILSSTPYCKSLNWAIKKGSDVIDGMWVTIGTWASGYLLNKQIFQH